MPFAEWRALIAPFYHAGKGPGRPPRELETMLRMRPLQCWFGLPGEGRGDAVLDSRAMQRFMKLDLMSEQVPDASTLRRFRHLLEDSGPGEAMPGELCRLLERAGAVTRGGSIVGAASAEPPSPAENAGGERDPEAHQAKKGKDWHFGCKTRARADAGPGLARAVEMTPADGSGIASAHELVRPDDGFCRGGSGHVGIEGREASVRSKAGHPFQVIKQRFDWNKTRRRGIKKNLHKARVMACLSNLAMLASAGRSLAPPPQAAPA